MKHRIRTSLLLVAAAAVTLPASIANADDWTARGDEMYFLGNIGIGRKNPKYQLEVRTKDMMRAIFGWNRLSQGNTYGVYGRADSPTGIGVYGYHRANTGTQAGVRGKTNSADPNAVGVYGLVNPVDAGANSAGVFGLNNSADGDGYGVWGMHMGSGSAVRADSFDGWGLQANSTNGVAVYGFSPNGWGANLISDGNGIGVQGQSRTGVGVKGVVSNPNANSWAGQFIGPVQVTGATELLGGIDGGVSDTVSAVGVHPGLSISGDAVIEMVSPQGSPSLIDFKDSTEGDFGARIIYQIGFGMDIRGTDFKIKDGDLTVAIGNAFKPGGGSWSSVSDVRLKKNINTIKGALDTLLALRGVTYEFKDPKAINELEGERIGFIAQELETVLPDWVSQGDDGFKRVTIRGFEALAVEAFREQADQISELESENAELVDRLAQLEALVAQLAASAD